MRRIVIGLGGGAALTGAIFLYLYFPFHWSSLKDSFFSALGDEVLGLWIFHRWSENLFQQPAHLFDGGIFYPSTLSLAFAETLVLPSLIYRLLHSLIRQPILAYHLTMVLMLLSNLATFYWAARHFWSRGASFLGALVFTFSMVRLGEFNHVQLVPQPFFPLIAYFLYQFDTTDRRRPLFLAALAIAGQLLWSIHFGVMAMLLAAPYVVIKIYRSRHEPRTLKRLLGFCALIAVLSIPIFLPYYFVNKTYGIERTLVHARPYSASLYSYLSPPRDTIYAPILRWIPPTVPHFNKHLFFGFMALALSILGWRHARKASQPMPRLWFRIGTATFVFLFLLSFGPVGGLYTVIYYIFPLLKALRVPSRFALAELLVVATFCVIGVEALLAKIRSPKNRGLLCLGLAALFLLENRVWYPLVKLPTYLEGSTEFLTHLPDRFPVIHLPLASDHGVFPGDQGNSWDNRECVRMYYGMKHRHPIFNGHSGFEPQDYQAVRQRERDIGPSASFLNHLAQSGLHYAVIEKNIVDPSMRERWIQLIRERKPIYEDEFTAIVRLES